MNGIKNIFNHKFAYVPIFVIWTLFITNLWLPRNWNYYGFNDWDLTYTTYEVARLNVVKYNLWPQYNPYLAFGSDLNANPQSVIASIFFLPVWLFGTFYGYKVSILMGILLGLFGMRKLLLELSKSKPVASLLAMFFCSAGYFSSHVIFAGHSNFLNFYLFPWLILYILKFNQNPRLSYLFIPSIVLAQMLSGGAPFAFIVGVLMVLLLIVFFIYKTGKLSWNNYGLFIPIILALGISYWKISSVLDHWDMYPRLTEDNSSISPLVWLDALCNFHTFTGTPHHWHEFSLGTGLLLPILIIAYRIQIPHFRFWTILFLLILWLSLGNTPEYFNPWYVMNHYLPFFTSLRAPGRFGFILLFMLISASSIVLIRVDNKLIYLILISIVLSNTLEYNSISRNMVQSRYLESKEEIGYDSLKPTERSISKYYDQFLHVRRERIIQDAYEPLFLSEVSDTLNSFMVGAELKSFSPEKIEFKATDTLSRFSLRYDPYWELDTDSVKVEQMGGLLAIRTQKDQNYTLSRRSSIPGGAVPVSLITLLITILLAFANLLKLPSLTDRKHTRSLTD